jgi:hypothetical protein
MQRIMHCLSPLAEAPAAGAAAIVKRAVASFTTMPAAEGSSPES